MYCNKTWTEKRKDGRGSRSYGSYICDCGNEFIAMTDNVKKGNTTKCGECAKKSRSAHLRLHGDSQKSKDEGGKGYYTWRAMIRRCENRSDRAYPSYGGRGISVCKRWRDSYAAFISDMGAPMADQSIERIDVDGNYDPENCKWASAEEQANNKRTNRFVTYKGQTKTLAQWCNEIGLDYGRTKARLTVHMMSPDQAFRKERLVRKNSYSIDGARFGSLKEAADYLGMSTSCVHARIKSENWPNWSKE